MSETLKLPIGYELLMETSAENGRGDITWRLRRMFGPTAPVTIGYFCEKAGSTKDDAIRFAIDDRNELSALYNFSAEDVAEPAPEPVQVSWTGVVAPRFYPVSYVDDATNAVVIMERGEEKVIVYGRTSTYEAEKIADRLGGVA